MSLVRRQRFYREYADRELSRIVISLVRENRRSQSVVDDSSFSSKRNSTRIEGANADDKRSFTFSEMFGNETVDEEERMNNVMTQEHDRLNSMFGSSSRE